MIFARAKTFSFSVAPTNEDAKCWWAGLLESSWKEASKETAITTSIWCSFWSINTLRRPKDSTKFRTVSSTDCWLMCRNSNKRRSWRGGAEMPVKVKAVMKVKIPCKRPSLYSCKETSPSWKVRDSFSSRFSNADNWRQISHRCTCLKGVIWGSTDHLLLLYRPNQTMPPMSHHRFSRFKDGQMRIHHFQK